jgi:peptidoglycan biosynthesis protein MviN/MurJ (putative lipid II flippase)
MYLPIGLFGVSIATATTPAIARQLALGDRATVRKTIADGLALMMMLNVPATIGLMVLAEPIIRLMYERGAFMPSDTIAAAGALQFYAVGLLGYSVVRIASPAFYALGRSRIPVAVSFIVVLVNAALRIKLAGRADSMESALAAARRALESGDSLHTLLMLGRTLGGIEAGHRQRARPHCRRGALMGAPRSAFTAIALRPAERPPDSADHRLSVTIGVALAVLAAAAHVCGCRSLPKASR